MSEQFPEPPPQGGAMPHGYVHYPEPSRALLALILAILNFFVCFILAPIAWYLGSQELTAIEQGRRDPTKRDHAYAAKVIGIIGTVLLGLFVVGILLFVVIIAASSA